VTETQQTADDRRPGVYGSSPSPVQQHLGQTAWLEHVQGVVDRVVYRPDTYRWRVEVDVEDPLGRVFVQLQHYRPDAFTGDMAWGSGGKSYLSPHMTDGELVRRLLGAALAYEEHEVREFFMYRPEDADAGEERRVFGPHIDVDALWDVADQLDVRQ